MGGGGETALNLVDARCHLVDSCRALWKLLLCPVVKDFIKC